MGVLRGYPVEILRGENNPMQVRSCLVWLYSNIFGVLGWMDGWMHGWVDPYLYLHLYLGPHMYIYIYTYMYVPIYAGRPPPP